jgi:DNA-binding MarR family transcriptional regulator
MSQSHAVIVSLLYAARTIESRGSALFAKWNLHPAQYNVLNLLATNDGKMDQAELKNQLVVSSATVAVVLGRMRKRGLVDNATNPDDRRRHTIMITPMGRKVWSKAADAYHQALGEVDASLSAAELKTLERLCTKLTSGITRHYSGSPED